MPRMIAFAGVASLIKSDARRASMLHTFHLSPEELSNDGKGYLSLISAKEFEQNPLFIRTEWCLLAITEFQDLQATAIVSGRPFPNPSKYLYFEGLSTLREMVLAGCNNTIHASLALLRTVIELMVYHLWWQRRLESDDEWFKFKDWLVGMTHEKDIGVKRVLQDIYENLNLPEMASSFDTLYKEYSILCSYVHKPLLEQSLITIKGTNQTAASAAALRFWFERVGSVTACILDLLIGAQPQSLFPIDICRKFGFNTPVGVFFDHFNFLPVQKALPQEKLENYQKHYKSHLDVSSLMEFYNDRPVLTDIEILNSWTEEKPDKDPATIEDQIVLRYAMIKAKMRAFLWTAAYGGFSEPSGLSEAIGSRLSE